MDLTTVRSVYLIGIKGVGMTALAQVLRGRGIVVSGSDTTKRFFTDDVLRRAGIPFLEEFSASNIPLAVDLVVRSTAYGEDHVEVAETHRRGFPILTYPEAIAGVFNGSWSPEMLPPRSEMRSAGASSERAVVNYGERVAQRSASPEGLQLREAGSARSQELQTDRARRQHIGVAVCGSHGKTTTTAMLGYVLQEAGLDPTVIVGSDVPQFARQNSARQSVGGFGGCARVGRSDLVVLEADEYQDKLAYYQPFGVILTNIDYDHPDFFPTPEAYADAFRRFIARIPRDGFLVACADDGAAMEAARAARCAVIAYGHGDLSPFRTKMRTVGTGALAGISLQIPGAHNVQNALAVLAASEQLGVPRAIVLRALASFHGTRRRFEVIGEVAGVTVIDDYGHHPTEIRATLAAVRERFSGHRVLCAFQPHTFTRTIVFQREFAAAFDDADRVYVMDIFGSARETHGGITAADLADRIAVRRPAVASGGVLSTIAALAAEVRAGDVVLCMGAGENDAVARGLVERLRDRG